MDLGFLEFSVFVMMISSLGDVRCSADGAMDCPCPAILPVHLTQPPPETCFQINSGFRYSCINGYVRKAGTSNLIKCQTTSGVAEWTVPTLQCIPDPKIIPTPTPSQAVKDGPKIIPTPTPSPAVKPAATTSQQMTQSISTSASVTAETDSTEPTSSGLQVLSVHTQAATTSQQMTQSISTSASVTAETDSTEPTSSGLQVLSVHTQAGRKIIPTPTPSSAVKKRTGTVVVTETKTMARMRSASTTAVPSLGSTVEPQRHEFTGTIAKISIVSVAIICACAGLSFYFYKRRTRNMIPVRTSEDDDVPMEDIHS